MNFIAIAQTILAQKEAEPSPTSVGFELEIWRWVVIIAVGAFVAIFLVKRLGDVVAKKRTEAIIDDVVGPGASEKAEDWVDDHDHDHDDEEEDKDKD